MLTYCRLGDAFSNKLYTPKADSFMQQIILEYLLHNELSLGYFLSHEGHAKHDNFNLTIHMI